MNKKIILFIAAVFILSFLSFHKAFGFDLWRDDWSQIWGSVYDRNYLLNGSAIRLHPISAYEQLILGSIFKFNYFYWQAAGYLLRVVDALVLAWMIFGITKSKNAAVFSGLFFASTLVGIESNTWISAHTSAIDFLLIAPGIYFWIISESERSAWKYLIALIFFVFATFADPGRGILVIGISFLWSVFTIIQKLSKESLLESSKRLLPLLILFYFLQKYFESTGYSITKTLFAALHSISINPVVLQSIINSIGNMLIGWIFTLKDSGGLSSPSNLSYFAGLLFIMSTFICGVFFLWKRAQTSKILFFFFLWIWLFYFPNWLFDLNLVVGATHRYLMLSSIGLAGIIGFCLSKLKQKIGIVLLLLLILLNIKASNRVLSNESYTRSAKVVEPLWIQINRQVPKNERNSIFIYGGNDPIRLIDLDWSGSVPFGIKRKYKNIDDFPIIPVNNQMILDLVCGKKIARPSIGQWSIQKVPIPLSHLHAWNLDNGKLTDVSVFTRKQIKTKLYCKYQN